MAPRLHSRVDLAWFASSRVLGHAPREPMRAGRFLRDVLFASALALAFSGCKTEQKCSTLMACSMQGRCTNKGDLCVATSDAECKQSSGCKQHGLCRAVDGKCEK